MVIYGRNGVREAIRSGLPIQKIFVARGASLPRDLEKLIRAARVPTKHVSREKLDSLTGTTNHQGIAAVISPVEFEEPHVILRKAVENRGVVVILDHVEDPQNLGSIIRTAEVLGADGVVIPKDRSATVTETVVKASAGAVFHIPIARVANIRNVMRDFKEMGGWVAAVEVGGENIYNFQPPFPLALVLGSEGRGVSKSVLKDSDFVVSISMKGKVNSLNVSAAAAIAIFMAMMRKEEEL